jgi:2-methylcitrate synthase
MPSMLLYWHAFTTSLLRIETSGGDDTTAGAPAAACCMIKRARNPMHQQALDVSLTLYAEHEFNASTFTARTITSTLSDFYSAVTGAIGALRGPLHGGANEAAMELIQLYRTPEEAETGIMNEAGQEG